MLPRRVLIEPDEFLPLRTVSITSTLRFADADVGPPAVVRAQVGRSGLFFIESIEEVFPDRFEDTTDDTTFDCYVLLNERDEARFHDILRNRTFDRPAIFTFGFSAEQFVLPRVRTIPRSETLDDALQRFVPADDMILKIY